jgi:hypothetical protein
MREAARALDDDSDRRGEAVRRGDLGGAWSSSGRNAERQEVQDA